MSSVTVSVRLPEKEGRRLDRLAKETGEARHAFLRPALRRGAGDIMFERACRVYRAGEATLSRAAEIADVPLPEMILKLKDAESELNCGVDDLEKDLQL
jgi:predicted transcriptional regulator